MPTPIQQLQAILHNRQYRYETTPEIIQFAKDNNLVIVFGASDDLVEFRGAIDDEVGSYGENTIIHFSRNNIFGRNEGMSSWCNSDCSYFTELLDIRLNKLKDLKTIIVKGNNPYWTYQVDFAHLTFDILEDEDKYYEGIIFSLDIFKPV